MIAVRTLKEIRDIGFVLLSNWNAERKEIALKGKNLYNLIALKKKIVEESEKIQEGLNVISEQSGGILDQEKGQYKIPQDKVPEVVKKMDEMLAETTEIEYEPIIITEDCSLPIGLMDILFDFIEFQD